MEKNNKNENINLSESERIVRSIPKVENMTSNKGNDIPNQFIIQGNGWKLFQSYSSPIALIKDGITYIYKDWDYSTTTGKYRNIFLNETKTDTLNKLKSGEYIAVDFEVSE